MNSIEPAYCLRRPEWRQSHPDKPYEYKSRHRARLAGCEGEFAAEEWAALKRRFRYRCVRCGAFEGSLWAPQLSPDHIVPLSRGGKNTIDNIQPLCLPCNRWKRSKIIDFRERRHEMDKVFMLRRTRHSMIHVERRTMPDEAAKSPSIGRFASSCSA